MQITKYTHACVRLERDGSVLVIDPGTWSEPDALLGADAVLVTHEHTDHVDRHRLAGAGIPVFAPAGANIPQLDFHEVTAGEEITVAGFTIWAVGGRHAVVYGDSPGCVNLGYVVDDVYHPGDALHVPDQPVRTLLVPAQASWLKVSEVIDFGRAVDPEHAFAIHDGQLNQYGREAVGKWLARHIAGYRWLAPGESA